MHLTAGKWRLGAITLAALSLAVVLALAACGSASTTGSTAGTTSTAVSASETTGSSSTSAPSSTASSAPTAQTQELTVSAASSLKGAFTEIGKAFDQANNSKTTFNFDASGTLQKQIEGGAPVDVFASAALKQVDALLKEGLVDQASVRDFAGNEIVLVVPAGSKLGITSFQDLTKADVKKIAYGDPKVAPHGVAAEEILNKLGIFAQVKPKVIYAANVSQALNYVRRGEVDAGILFVTEALAGGDKIKIVATSDPSWHSKIVYPIAVVSATKNKTLAQAFVDYVAGAEGQAVLKKFGFLPAPTQ